MAGATPLMSNPSPLRKYYLENKRAVYWAGASVVVAIAIALWHLGWLSAQAATLVICLQYLGLRIADM
eukprot:CAMPEP_0119108912 /NCGR_PEP_ID=MMETSP1180-20130426/16139_1 /TAXON_ID=3052 ORGANISM="Chlamydomonas cf sp, Strain CCMP681" /NCGR_SAMPLE_ID=MMETSP1180 /ASSEMBLY_ACC=CAM_ASM_000741 /LENGTH=67 /DNA_ID=CAMNT_0007094589 /DNA_START=135 /DNA_END=338 /DNA_ORIENTATION=+